MSARVRSGEWSPASQDCTNESPKRHEPTDAAPNAVHDWLSMPACPSSDLVQMSRGNRRSKTALDLQWFGLSAQGIHPAWAILVRSQQHERRAQDLLHIVRQGQFDAAVKGSARVRSPACAALDCVCAPSASASYGASHEHRGSPCFGCRPFPRCPPAAQSSGARSLP